MFILGVIHKRTNNRISKISSILNFDFAVVALIIAACIKSRQNVMTKKGRTKDWFELLELMQKFYTNKAMLADLTSLHDLRNSIQHGDTVPSDYDIDKYDRQFGPSLTLYVHKCSKEELLSLRFQWHLCSKVHMKLI